MKPRYASAALLVLTLTACGAEKDRHYIDVTGYAPEAGATVTIWSGDGSDQAAITGDDGSFVFHLIKAPYDILYASKSWRSLRLGSSATHQNFGVILRGGSNADRSFVHMAVAGRDTASTYALWGIDCGRDEVTSGPMTAFTDIFPSFFVDEPTTCAAEALAVSRAGDVYSGYGATDVVVNPREEGFFSIDATQAVPSHLEHFSVGNYNSALTNVGTGLLWAFGQYSTSGAVLRDGDLSQTDLALVERPDLHLAAFFGSADSDTKPTGYAYAYRALNASQTDFDVVIPSANILAAPAVNDAHLAERDELAVTPLEGVVYQLTFDAGEVVTTRPSISIAELEDRGMSFDRGVRQHVQVSARTGSSVDADTSENALVRLQQALRISTGTRSFYID